ncbi:MAG: hypothetical protein LUC47_06105 [Clostridiales bacterium]|nr:hypothetical protein [Clostridiales bacterium]
MSQELYTAIGDPYFAEPYIDEEEWRDTPVRHYYVHGGFRNTEVQGQEVKFCFYFPEKDKYEGRFFQYLSPAPENERESEKLTGEDDKIACFLTHGGYYVVSNQGGFVIGDCERLYKSSANTAQFSRTVAQRVYGYEHRPYGYVFGGSGGSFKTMSCIEATTGVWDGGCPYVLANPMATPNVFCARLRVMRMLGTKGLDKLVDVMQPGGSGDILEGLEGDQRDAVIEACKMGFPKRAWFCHPYMGDGSLMVLAPTVKQIAPSYFEDFWTKEGYAGADPNSSEYRDRVQFVTKVRGLLEKNKSTPDGDFSSVDTSWINTMVGNQTTPDIVLEEEPPEGSYLFRCKIKVLTGKAAGKEQPVESLEHGVIVVSSAFDGQNSGNALEGLAVGDEVMIDNSDYLAMQTLQRHQVPDETYYVYDQYRNEDGTPKYPQIPMLIAPLIAQNGGGTVPNGKINSKIIVNCSLLDESALPWHGDWYRSRVREAKGDDKDWMRLYYNDNCIHDDRAGYLDDAQFTVDYLGMLHQSLFDLADWVEKGIEPPANTQYRVNDGQVEMDNSPARQGLQPVVHSWANGQERVRVKVGETVHFTAEIEATPGGGAVTYAAWDFEKTNDFSNSLELHPVTADGSKATVSADHAFQTPGTWFPVIKVQSSRSGSTEDIFTQCKNLSKVRVIVEN